MQNIVHRARRVYHNEGFMPTLQKSIRFIPRYLRHVLGTKGLYSSPIYQNLLLWWNSRPYSAVQDPFEIVRISPNEINHVTGRGPNPGRFKWQDIGKIQSGNWDQSEHRVDELPVVQALRERFEESKDWDEIEFIQHVLEQAERGNVIWRGCTNDKDVREACEQVDSLYRSIRDEGYRSRQNLIEETNESPDKYVEGDGFNRYNEVVVDVGRDGQFLFVDGRHRLAIAKILELEEIPVRISARHAKWQEMRESIHGGFSNEVPAAIDQNLDHPDLQDLEEAESGDVEDL